MPTITIRVTDEDKAKIESSAQMMRLSVSDFVRLACGIHPVNPEDRIERLEAHVYDGIERRLYRLELLAGEAGAN